MLILIPDWLLPLGLVELFGLVPLPPPLFEGAVDELDHIPDSPVEQLATNTAGATIEHAISKSQAQERED